MKRIRWIAAAASIGCACSSSYGESGGGSPAIDGGVTPTGAPDAAPDAADTPIDAGRTNLLTNGDFQAGCGGWVAVNGNLVALTSASGNGMCRVCVKASAPVDTYYSIEQSVPSRTWPKGTYTFEAVVMAGTTAAGSPSDVTLGDYLAYPDGGFDPVQTTTGPALDATRQKVTHVFTLTDATEASINVSVQGTGGGCFMVDDAALYGPP